MVRWLMGLFWRDPDEAFRGDSEDILASDALRVVAAVALFGLIPVVVYGLTDLSSALSIISVGLMTAGACVLAGCLLGFLFGIPRALQLQVPQQSASSAEGGNGGGGNGEGGSGAGGDGASTSRQPAPPASTAGQASSREASGSLEQIADWLTKIIIGIGLVELGQISGVFREITAAIAQGLGSASTSQPFASVILIYFTACGFMFGYLWARIYLLRLYNMVDYFSSIAEIRDSARKLAKDNKRLQQDLSDAMALAAITRHLDLREARLSLADLRDAISTASPRMLENILVEAELWRATAELFQSKEHIGRAKSVYDTLIAVDPDHVNHAAFAGRGYCWIWEGRNAEAKKDLDCAITKRDKDRASIVLPFPDRENYYELFRAICTVHMDPNAFRTKAERKVRERVEADLAVSMTYPPVRYNILSGQYDSELADVTKWMKFNDCSLPPDWPARLRDLASPGGVPPTVPAVP